MKLLIPLIFTPFISQAETFPLSTHESWGVFFVSASDDMPDYCMARVQVPYASFSLDYRLDGGLRVWIIQQNAPWAVTDNGLIYLWSDKDLVPWEAPVSLYWDSANFLLAGQAALKPFLLELSVANVLYIDYNVEGGNGPAADVMFPLDGSAEAITALADCVQKLGVPM